MMMDKEAHFKTVIADSRESIYRLCCCYVMDDDARKDVYQEVLIHLWKSLDSFQGRSSLSTWIYRVTVNTCLAHLRAEKRRKRVYVEGGSMDAADVSETAAPTEERESEIKFLYACIDRLDPVDRALISLYLEDVSTREMAEILGISEVNVRVKLHRVKKNLKDLWEGANHELG